MTSLDSSLFSLPLSFISGKTQKKKTHECRCSHASASFRNCTPRVDTSTVAAISAARTRARSQFARKSFRTLVPREEEEEEVGEEDEKAPFPSLRLPPKPPLSLGSPPPAPWRLEEEGDGCAPLRRKGCVRLFLERKERGEGRVGRGFDLRDTKEKQSIEREERFPSCLSLSLAGTSLSFNQHALFAAAPESRQAEGARSAATGPPRSRARRSRTRRRTRVRMLRRSSSPPPLQSHAPPSPLLPRQLAPSRPSPPRPMKRSAAPPCSRAKHSSDSRRVRNKKDRVRRKNKRKGAPLLSG